MVSRLILVFPICTIPVKAIFGLALLTRVQALQPFAMKNFMKLVLLCMISLWSLSVSGQTNSDVLIVRVYESSGNNSSKIMVLQGETVLKTIDGLKMLNGDNVEGNSIFISRILNDYLKQGYEIISSVSGGVGSSLVTTYVLNKD